MTVPDNDTSGKVGGRGLCWGVLGHSWLGSDTCDTSEIRGEQNERRSWNSKLTPYLLPHQTGEFLVVHARLSRGSGHLQQETFRWLTSKRAIIREGLTSQGMSVLRNTPEPLHRTSGGLALSEGTSHQRYCQFSTRMILSPK